MKTLYEANQFDIISKGLIPFIIQTKKGRCHGVFSQENNTIFVHGIYGNKCLKGLMQILINKFKTNKITFTPLITESIPTKVRGVIKVLEANHPDNPYGEKLIYMECEWNKN